MLITRVEITENAAEVLNNLKTEHGKLIFHQSGGCCDGTTPMLLKKDELYIDDSDVLVGKIENVEYYMNKDQFEYWKHMHITIDVTKGRGGSFSLETSLEFRFIIHSRLFTEKEKDYFTKTFYLERNKEDRGLVS